MPEVCSIDRRARQQILRELKQLATGLQRDFRIEAVYVFGSFARHAEHEASDIDLLVIGELPGRVFERVGEVLRRTTLPVEPIVVRKQTYQRWCRDGHPLFRDIADHGLRLV